MAAVLTRLPARPDSAAPTPIARATALALAEARLPWLRSDQRLGRMLLVPVGFLPVTLIAGVCFGADLRTIALGGLLPGLVLVAGAVGRHRWGRRLLVQAVAAGVVATALYDLFRFAFLWAGWMDGDPIPHIGAGLGLEPHWVFGYLWRYLLNGGGLAVAFTALGLRGARPGAAYGTFVAAGLLAVLFTSPHGGEVLFPANSTTVVMAVIGHLVYGSVLGALRARSEERARLERSPRAVLDLGEVAGPLVHDAMALAA